MTDMHLTANRDPAILKAMPPPIYIDLTAIEFVRLQNLGTVLVTVPEGTFRLDARDFTFSDFQELRRGYYLAKPAYPEVGDPIGVQIKLAKVAVAK